MANMSKRSPLAVLRPLNTLPYQEAMPWSRSPRLMAVRCAARESGAGAEIEGAAVMVATGRESRASACTVRVEIVTTNAASAIDETPAANHIRSGVFRFKLRDFRFMTIRLFYQVATTFHRLLARLTLVFLLKIDAYLGSFSITLSSGGSYVFDRK
jgi:hypothetical protein